MTRLDRHNGPAQEPVSTGSRGVQRAPEAAAIHPSPLLDQVPWDCPGAAEIGFALPERYNASEILFQNLTAGRSDHLAVVGPAGGRSYAQLAADAARWGHALLSLGLNRGDRVILLLDDTPVYPAAFFGIVRAGLVPILVNVLTPPDLLQFYFRDSGAKVALAEAAFCEQFAGVFGLGVQLRTLIIVNGGASPAIPDVEIKQARQWLRNFPDHLAAADTHRNDMAFWMYSSGSTGNPKGIVHLQHDMAFTHLSYGRHVLKLMEGDICFSSAKIFFSYGFGNSITFPFSVGATSLLMPGRATAQAVTAAIAQYRPPCSSVCQRSTKAWSKQLRRRSPSYLRSDLPSLPAPRRGRQGVERNDGPRHRGLSRLDGDAQRLPVEYARAKKARRGGAACAGL
ncbi:MAG TPA: AMP-binding protein [Xanthobacteraceae bacterium]